MAATELIKSHLAQLDVPVEGLDSAVAAYPIANPVDVFRLHITNALHQITGADVSVIYPQLKRLQALDKGDLTLAAPALRCKGAKPADQAREWAQQFSESKYVNSPVTTGINLSFYFRPTLIPRLVLPYVFTLGSSYGFNSMMGHKDSDKCAHRNESKKMVVEFSSPNIAKEFHQGHLRSTIIGSFLANLYSRNGWDVVRLNYLGDWGRQYGLLAVGWERHGSEDLLKKNATKHLFDVYPEQDAYKIAHDSGEDTAVLETQGLLGASKTYFNRMEAGDEEALATWRRFRNMSIDKYKQSYSRLNIAFDEYSGESQVLPSTMEMVERILKQRGISEFDQGATIIDFKKFGAKDLDFAIIRNRAGATTYLLRDIGAAIQRYEQYGFDSMLYVIMSEQSVHANRLFKALALMGDMYEEMSKKMQLVEFGKVQGMSTRRGTVKFLEDVLDECATSMHEVMRRNEEKYQQVDDPDTVANILGISAVMVQDMKGKRINNYPFDIEKMTSFEGDTGPYLQYAHARLCSVSRKSGFKADALKNADFSLLTESHAVDLVRLIAQFPDIVTQTLKTLEPTTILTYLFRLTHQVSSSYDHLRVIGAPEDVSFARAALYEAARQVLSNGMTLLGMVPVERM